MAAASARGTLWTWSLALLLGAWSFGAIGPVCAQNLPPQVLEELRRQQGTVSGPRRQRSALDEARRGGQDMDAGESLPLEDYDPNAEPSEEDAPEEPEPTALEDDYRARLEDETLEQYGYDLLTSPRLRRAAASTPGRIGENYVLGIGDEIAIVVQGQNDEQYITAVDSEGRLLVRGLSPVAAAGRSFGDVVREVKSRVSDVFVGADIYLSVASVAQVGVIVSGEVEAPGRYLFTAQQSVIDALIEAQGVRKTGSLRDIRLVRDGQMRSVDLYTLLRGRPGTGLLLRDGDQIIIPRLGPTYAVSGQVLQSGIFELPPGTTSLSASTALEVAGGPLRPRGFSLVLSRLNADGTEVIEEAKATDRLIAGDGLVIVRTSARTLGKIAIMGHVEAPGMRALESTQTLGDLLAASGGYKSQPYLPFGVLVRENALNLSDAFVAVNLLSKGQDGLAMQTKNGDRLVVLSRKDATFLSSPVVRQIILTQSYEADFACAPLSNLAQLTQDLQTERFASVLRGAFVVEENGKAELASVTSGSDQTTLERTVTGPIPVTDDDLDILDDEEAETLRQTYCPAVYRDYPGLMPFALEHLVSVSGSVRQPIVLPVASPLGADVLVELAGGLSFEAQDATLEVRSGWMTDMSKSAAQRQRFALSDVSLEALEVGPGATVAIQSQRSEQEPGTVLLSGEFMRPGVYTIERGEKLSSLIKRAGGLSERAYPYGAVFTRVSVKQAQQQAFKRTVREMNTALATAALKNNVDAEALAAAQELTRDMQSVEALGRVVVEADPRVLELRKDLDVVLEAGDRLLIPSRPNHVLAMGDILNPGALQFVRGKTVSQYLAETGGIQSSADKGRIFLVYPNGVAQPLPSRFWGSQDRVLPPGSTIVVPMETDPLATLQLTREITSIVSQLALSAASFAVIFDR